MSPIGLLLVLIASVLAVRWCREWMQRRGATAKQTVLVWMAIGILFTLAMTGKLGLIVPLVATAVAVLLRLAPLLLQMLPVLLRILRQHQTQRTRTAGDRNRSAADAKYVHLDLNHATGELSGRVTHGRYAGRDLHGLTLDELSDLHRECRSDDPDSMALLEAYLDRVYGQKWRAAGDPAGARPAGQGNISRDDAYRILGLEPGAPREAVIQAHRRLMQKLHPDRGGSDYLAAEINRAKEILLGNS